MSGVTSGMERTATRVILAGSPRCGKTTLSAHFAKLHPNLRVRHTDDLISLGWSEASEAASRWLDDAGPWLVEGTAAIRAVRKWLDRNREGKPCDILMFLDTPFEALSPGQASMARGIRTVLEEIRPELERRGVEVKEP